MQHHSGISADPADDSINLLDIWRTLWEGWWIILASLAIALVVGGIYLATATPQYRAATVIAEVEASSRSGHASQLIRQFGGLANLVGADLGARPSASSNGRTIIQSRTFLEEFIARNDLLPLIFADQWDTLSHPPSLAAGAGVLRQAFELILDRETGLLTLVVEWPDADLAQQWANEIVMLANQVARERDITEAQRSVAYLNNQIASTNVLELQRVLYDLLKVEQQTLMLANARDEYVFQVIDPALRPNRPAKPKAMVILVLSILVGTVLGLVLIYVRTTIRHLREYGRPTTH